MKKLIVLLIFLFFFNCYYADVIGLGMQGAGQYAQATREIKDEDRIKQKTKSLSNANFSYLSNSNLFNIYYMADNNINSLSIRLNSLIEEQRYKEKIQRGFSTPMLFYNLQTGKTIPVIIFIPPAPNSYNSGNSKRHLISMFNLYINYSIALKQKVSIELRRRNLTF